MALFVDTGFFIALLNEEDKFHARAAEIARESFQKEKLYTSDYVLDELYTFVHKLKVFRQEKVLEALGNIFRKSAILEILFVGERGFGLTQSYFIRNPEVADFTDWASAVLVEEHGIGGILSFDSDFDKIANFPYFKNIKRLY